MAYGKTTLAQTGAAAASMTVMGVTVPYVAIAAAGFVTVGAVLLRVSTKLKARNEQ